MSQERSIAEIVAEALSIADERARDAFVSTRCGSDAELRQRVEELLANVPDAQSFLALSSGDSTIDLSGEAPKNNPSLRQVDEQIGNYKVVRRIGEGGMGTVYEAEQQRPRRTVALKVIRPGLASPTMLKRFEFEAHVLGRLQHPGIAQIYEAGTAETSRGVQPYFAMELVRGSDLTAYVRSANLSTDQRLELMAKICDAVHYAHRQGVIHRDLKPGNILVTAEGQPKILDFGVARATDADMQVTTQQTDVGQIIGTLQYMSPEQIAAVPDALDTRSDVYALGVIAYELLAGHAPYNLRGRMIHEAARVVQEEEPTRLSGISRAFRGDIDTIVAKALEKDKTRRYDSAAELGEDIRRYLRDEPIVARPPSAMYQLEKFAKRNKALAAGLAIALTALVVGFVTSTYLYIQAERARSLATTNERRANDEAAAAKLEADKARTIQEYIRRILAEADPRRTRTHETTMRDVLDAAATRLEGQFEDQPEVRAAIERTIGESYFGLLDFEKALPHLNAAVSLMRSAGDTQSDNYADTLHLISESYSYLGRSEGVPYAREELELRQALVGERHPDAAIAKQYLGFALFRAGLSRGGDVEAFREAERLVSEALDTFNEHPDATPAQRVRCLHLHAVLLGFSGRIDDAVAAYPEALAQAHEAFGVHPYTWDCLDDYAMFLDRVARYAESAAAYDELVEMGLELFGPDDDKVAVRMLRGGNVYLKVGDLAAAEALYDRALDIWRRRDQMDHIAVMHTREGLAFVYSQTGRSDRSLPTMQEGAKAMREGLIQRASPSRDERAGAADLAKALIRFGDPELGVSIMRELAVATSANLGDEDPTAMGVRLDLARTLERAGRVDEAIDVFANGVEVQERTNGPDAGSTLSWVSYHGEALRSAGRLEDAERELRRAFEGFESKFGKNEHAARAGLALARVLMARDRYEEALEVARESFEAIAFVRGRRAEHTAEARGLIVEILRKLGRDDEAIELRREEYEIAAQAGGPAVPEAFDFGVLLRRAERSELAAQVFFEGWQSLRSADGDTPPEGLVWMGNHAACLGDLGRLDEAEKLFREAYDGYRIVEGSTDDRARSAIDMFIVLRNQQRTAESIPFLREAIDLRLQRSAPSASAVIDLRRSLADALRDIGELDEAEQILKASLDLIDRETRAKEFSAVAKQLIDLYRHRDELDPEGAYGESADALENRLP